MSDIEFDLKLQAAMLSAGAVLNNTDLLIERLDAGADIETRDTLGRTPLIVAAEHGSHEVIKELLRRDADPNATGDAGNTPLHAAAYTMDRLTIHMLVDAGADVNAKNSAGVTPRDEARTGYGLCLDLLRRPEAYRRPNTARLIHAALPGKEN